MPGKKKRLVIIESPAKARSLRSYLGPEYEVVASIGHVRDLPRNRLGVNEDNGFTPVYTVLPEQRKTVLQLKKKVVGFDRIYLAADPDREGEAICWHLSKLLDGKGRIFRRLKFNSVTRKAVLDAIRHPSSIDMNLVDAQQARRVMDRLVGYKISPYLWRTIGKGLSAGRVQTVALRIIQEREQEINSFVSREYWIIEVGFVSGETFYTARLFRIDGKKADGEHNAPESRKYVDSLLARIENAEWNISAVKKALKTRKPGPPFITSTLQSAASAQLSMQPSRTMRCAQELYEGISIEGDETTGLITYMRTDSVRINPKALEETRSYIESRWGKDALSEKTRRYRSSGSAQDAHEAIRPVNPARTPEAIRAFLTQDQYRLYNLIWKRLIATQMADAEIERTEVVFSGDGLEFLSTGEVIIEPGFSSVDPSQLRTGKPLPGEHFEGPANVQNISTEQKFTLPPSRFTEAGLVSEMKKKGIGRPSTYVSIISTLKKRKYVEPIEKKLCPTELGTMTVGLLLELFPHIFEIGFTAGMEKLLDSIASGETDYTDALDELSLPLNSSLKLALSRLPEIKSRLIEKTDEVCLKCGKPLVIKMGQYGKFYACTGFPECRYTRPFDVPDSDVYSDRACPLCGGNLVLRNGKYGSFLGCDNSPECRYSEPIPTGVACPVENCSGEIVERRSRKGRKFFSCNRYPECDFALWNKPIARICPRCGFPILEKRKKGIYCPRCRKKIEEP